MQPVGLESVELERKLLAESDQSMWYALSIAENREELLERKAEFLKIDSIERTEEIVSLLPSDHEVKAPLIAQIRQQLDSLPERPPVIPVDRPEELGRLLAQAQELIARRGSRSRAELDLEQTRDKLRPHAGLGMPHVGLAVSAANGGRLAQPAVRPEKHGQSRAAQADRPARELDQSLRQCARPAPVEDLWARQHLGYGRASASSCGTFARSIHGRRAIRCKRTKRRSR